MLIGKIWDEPMQKFFWSEAEDFDKLVQTLRNELADYGGDDEFDPAKIEVWSAVKMKVIANYRIEEAN